MSALVAHYPGPSAHLPGCRDIAYIGFRAPPQPWNEPGRRDLDPSEFEDLRALSKAQETSP